MTERRLASLLGTIANTKMDTAQMANAKSTTLRKPRILVTAEDLEVLEAMIGHASGGAATRLLEDELSRAVIVNASLVTRPFCRIGSWVTYEDLTSGQIRNIQIVLPLEADIDKRQVSVLSLVGASLLGLSADTEFTWSDDNGRPHRLRVMFVGDEPHAQFK